MFIDFKSAFDSISHDILFKKLKQLDIPEETINLIKFIYSKTRIFEQKIGKGVI